MIELLTPNYEIIYKTAFNKAMSVVNTYIYLIIISIFFNMIFFNLKRFKIINNKQYDYCRMLTDTIQGVSAVSFIAYNIWCII